MGEFREMPLGNPLTGEIGDTVTVYVDDSDVRVPRRGQKIAPTRFTTPYVTMFRPAVPVLAAMRADDLHVLMAVLDQIQPEVPEIRLDTVKAMTMTGLNPRSIHNSLTRLVKKAVILRPTLGHLGLNPLYFWCHGAESRERLLREQATHIPGRTTR